LSVIVFGAMGYAWATVTSANSGLTRDNVIDSNADNNGPQNILLVGIDTRTDAQGNPLPQDVLNQLHAGGSGDGGDNTDTIIVIHIPAGGGKAVAFSIPRDSYVELAGGYGKHKINSGYTYGQVAEARQLRAQGITGPELAKRAAEAGARNAVKTIEQFTGLQITHFASVNLVGFYDISKAIGGVQVCLKAAVHDSYSGASFPAGVQTIEGAQALAFVRQRHGLPAGDLDRIKRQQVFMASMAHTVLSAGVLANPSKLNSLVGAIQQTITLDRNWDLLGFAQQLQSMSSGAIQFQTIPIVNISLHTPSDGDAVQVDPQQVQAFIQQQIGVVDGSGTPATSAPATSSSAAAPDNAGVSVQVTNATGRVGLAAKVLNALTGQGFQSAGTGNGPARSTTVVEYGIGDQASAQKVVSALGGGITTTENTSLTPGMVKVILGKDYSGPTGATTSPTPASHSPSAPSTSSSQPAPVVAGAQNCFN
jgi:LCP family protein required for cell wall assembly